jgi:hypothetical protein
VVPLSPAERLGIAVACLGKGGSSQSGTTSSKPLCSSMESGANLRRRCPSGLCRDKQTKYLERPDGSSFTPAIRSNALMIVSGAVNDRPALHDALEFARSGDALIVWKLDRLAKRVAV